MTLNQQMKKDIPTNSFPVLDQYANYMQAVKGRSNLTVKEYRYDLIMFFRFITADRNLVDSGIPFSEIPIHAIDETFLRSISTDDLFAFLIYLSRERKASASNRARKVATLKSFFKYLFQKQKMIPENPADELDSPKIGKKLPRHLSLEESVQLLSTTEDEDGKNRERDYCMITFFLNCGMRLSELTGISLSDIHENTLTVIGKGDKERTIYLNGACLTALDEWMQVRKTFPSEKVKDKKALFISRNGGRISTQGVQYAVKRLITESGLNPRLYSVHKLRHTAATLMYQYGQVDIRSLQAILGHASVATTQIYTHVNDQALQKAVESNPLAEVKTQKVSDNSKDYSG